MTWQISFSKEANAFLEINNLSKEEIFDLLRRAIQKFQGENINVDIKKLRGKWLCFYRIRKGKLRIIAEFNFDSLSVFIEVIDWRGSAYK